MAPLGLVGLLLAWTAAAALTEIGGVEYDLNSPYFLVTKEQQASIYAGFKAEVQANDPSNGNYSGFADPDVYSTVRARFIGAEPEYEAIRLYTDSPSGLYRIINTDLRRFEVSTFSNTTLLIASGTHRLEQTVISQVLYRGLSSSGPAFFKFIENDDVTESGFMSTTTDLNIAYSYTGQNSPLLVLGEVNTAFDISGISFFPEEKENLISPGFVFRVLLIEAWQSPTKGKVTVVYGLQYPYLDEDHVKFSLARLRENFYQERSSLNLKMVLNRNEARSLGPMGVKRAWTERERYNKIHLAPNKQTKRSASPSSMPLDKFLELSLGRERFNKRRAPPLPAAWFCPAQFYDSNDGCDCNCGSYDPDCDGQDGVMIVYGCGGGPAPTCTLQANCSFNYTAVPSQWTCPLENYHAWDGCDCACGAVDPDCAFEGSLVFGCSESKSETCVNAQCVASPDNVPAGWVCTHSFYGTNDGCDCNCGVPDPDCATNSTFLFNCPCGPPDMQCEDGFCVGTCGGYIAGFSNSVLWIVFLVLFCVFISSTIVLLILLTLTCRYGRKKIYAIFCCQDTTEAALLK